MNVLIVEDESLAAEQLTQYIQRFDPNCTILGVLDSVEESVAWLSNNTAPDLIFLDIHLSDGLSFEIFNQCTINTPVIFTTAYDQYAIKAFKFNSIDYLLKPIKYEDLQAALEQYRSYHMRPSETPFDYSRLRDTLLQMQGNYKNRFLIKAGEQIRFKSTEEIAYLYAEGKITYLVDTEGKKFIVDYTLEELDSVLDPAVFYRATRKVIVKINSIARIVTYPNSRIKLYLSPAFNTDIIVSRDKTPQFLKWLDK